MGVSEHLGYLILGSFLGSPIFGNSQIRVAIGVHITTLTYQRVCYWLPSLGVQGLACCKGLDAFCFGLRARSSFRFELWAQMSYRFRLGVVGSPRFRS